MDTKKCPYCGEEIAAKAKKCRFCGEWLEYDVNSGENATQTTPVDEAVSQPVYQTPEYNVLENDQEVAYSPSISFFKAYFVNPYLRRYADFKGYTTRKSFWLTYVATLILSIGLGGLILLLSSFGMGGTIASSIISGVIGLALIVPGLALCARRLRDAGKNPWLILLGCIPVIGSIILLIFFCQESKYEDTEEKGHWQMPDWIVTGVCVVLLVLGIVFSLKSIVGGSNSYDLGEFEEVEEASGVDYDDEVQEVEELEYTNGNDVSESSTLRNSQSGADSKADWVVEFKGSIGKYPIKMYLNLKNIDDYDWCEVEGKYCYTSSGSGSYLYVSGVKQGDSMELTEYNDKGEKTGTFYGEMEIYGNLSSMEYTGTFTNYKGKDFKFSLRYN